MVRGDKNWRNVSLYTHRGSVKPPHLMTYMLLTVLQLVKIDTPLDYILKLGLPLSLVDLVVLR
jgi:hypothetical protein